MSSNESKQFGVFIDYYDTNLKVITSPTDFSKIEIKEIYTEYIFEVSAKNEILPSKYRRMIIRFSSEPPEDYSMNWLVGDYNSFYFTIGKDYMDADLSNSIEQDTLKFPIGILDSVNRLYKTNELILIRRNL